MVERIASCRCGQLRATCSGEPGRISVCHCLDCQTRSGSAFTAQARWPEASVSVTGEFATWSPRGGSASFNFCPVCGSTVTFTIASLPGQVAVAIGAFADPQFPAPNFSVYENRKHDWVAIIGDEIERH